MSVRLPRSAAIRLIALVVLLLGTLAPAGAFAQGDFVDATPIKSSNGIYIVQLAEPPVAEYTGGIAGIPAPKFAVGGRPDVRDPNVQAYIRHLTGRHQDVARAAGSQGVLYSYRYTYNGFAARMTAEQAGALRGTPGVLTVEADEIRQADTVTTPNFLGLTKPGGLWSQLGGPTRAGEGIIVGIIDSGLWAENPSFADNGAYGRIPLRWNGACVTGEEWDAADCSNKVIGARYYNVGMGGNAGIDANRPWEFNSARDYNGHGSHTASTSAGNYNVPFVIQGTNLGMGSGMAPRARIAVYKALWSTQDASTASGTNADLLAAIDEATADGVDVINYSISGSQTSIADPVEIAFLRAARSGVFVSASAGNSGPTASTVAHNSPWIMTVAAGTHDRGYEATITLGNGATYKGVSLGNGTAVAPVIKSSDAALTGADATAARLCFSAVTAGAPVLDPAKVAGKIVQCDRGSNARVDKSLAVQQAGGIGVILTNTAAGQSLNADLHYIPTIHVDNVMGDAIRAYITADPGTATAELGASVIYKAQAPAVADFSSRGPARALAGDLLKPDILAPGVDVLAAVSPASGGGYNYNFYSGTSMSAPHIAGLAALLKQRQPSWSPDMIKSALMTTTSQKTNFGNPLPGNPFGYGAGQVNPSAAVNPGLVYRIRMADYGAFLCGQGILAEPACAVRKLSVFDLNLPSFAAGSLAGEQTFKRTVFNVTGKTATYTASIEGMAGFNVQVTPATITVPGGGSANFTLKVTRTTAALNAYTFGALNWTSGSTKVRSPIAVRPVGLAAPAEFAGEGTSGTGTINVKFGYDGEFSAVPHGLVPATKLEGTVNTGGYVDFVVSIPTGVKFARFSLFDEYTNAPDLDLDVYRGATLVGTSGSGTSAEQVNLVSPLATSYTVRVIGYDTGAQAEAFTLFVWQVTEASAGNLTVTAPATATTGVTGAVTLDWTGLDAGTKYLGTVTYHNVAAPANYDAGRIGMTVVGVDTD